MTRQLIASVFALSFMLSLGACGDTWRGAKKDTGENLEATGDAIKDSGEEVKD